MAAANGFPGFYFALDGIVGCGKSRQIDELKIHLPLDFPGVNFEYTYEPGGTPEADRIRQRVKFETMSSMREAELYAESRAITLPRVVAPVLARGDIMASDRCFSTSLTYQAFGRKLGLYKVWELNRYAVNGVFPDLLIYLKVGLEASLKRSSGDNPDKFDQEARDFWHRIVPGYDEMIKFLGIISPNTKVIQINDPEGAMNVEETRLAIKSELYPILNTYLHEGRILRDRQV
jgi:dTMP kinase